MTERGAFSLETKQAIQSAILERIEHLAGKSITGATTVQGGYTPAARLLVSFSDGATLFAKVGTTAHTAGELHKEQRLYESLAASSPPGLASL